MARKNHVFVPRRPPLEHNALEQLRLSEEARLAEAKVRAAAVEAAERAAAPRPDPWPGQVNDRLAALEEQMRAVLDIVAGRES
ncbi:MAG: hypothetical protein ACYCUG_06090 [Acidimicrobiales bacterium]